jgi:cell wall-associated NlpC family hydrolase
LRVRSLTALIFALVPVLGTGTALAANTGGASAEPAVSTTTTSTTGAATPAVPLAPVTAKTSKLSYKGPVYERTATGEVIPYVAPSKGTQATASSTTSATGGAPAVTTTTTTTTTANGKPDLLVPGTMARFVGGLAAAPMSAPAVVQEIIWAGNQIVGLPYIWGGGHASFISPGYDCSGTVSFALHGGNLLSTPMDSSEFMHWGAHGEGQWVTIFTDPEHAYMTVAGLRLDTSSADDPSNLQGPRWRPLRQSNAGYSVRHPVGL